MERGGTVGRGRGAPSEERGINSGLDVTGQETWDLSEARHTCEPSAVEHSFAKNREQR